MVSACITYVGSCNAVKEQNSLHLFSKFNIKSIGHFKTKILMKFSFGSLQPNGQNTFDKSSLFNIKVGSFDPL